MERIEALLSGRARHSWGAGRPLVTLSYAQSLDGCIAATRGQPMVLSSREALGLTHRLRAGHDAILVGIGTVLADNPRLTVRLVAGQNPQPVIVDSRLRFPLGATLLCGHPLSPWIAACDPVDPIRQKVLEGAGARVLRLPSNPNGQVNLVALLERLGECGIGSLLVEGGARIITSFLQEGLADLLVLTVSPLLVGGLHAVDALQASDPAYFPRLDRLRCTRLGDNLILWGELARHGEYQ